MTAEVQKQKRTIRWIKIVGVLFLIGGLLFLVDGVLQSTIFKIEPISFNRDGPNDGYAYIDVRYAAKLAWTKENYREKPRYFYRTSSNGVSYIFELSASSAQKYEAALIHNAQQLQSGDERVLDMPPVLRVHGHAASLDDDLVARMYRMGHPDEFRELFGNCYFKQSGNNEVFGLFFMAFNCMAFGLTLYWWGTLFNPETGRMH